MMGTYCITQGTLLHGVLNEREIQMGGNIWVGTADSFGCAVERNTTR